MKHLVLTAVLLLLFPATVLDARAQDGGKIEIGGLVAVANLSNGQASVVTTVACSPAPCAIGFQTTTETGRGMEPGFGTRIGYAVNPYLTVEAEGNYFPRGRDIEDERFTGGRKLQGLFGVKVG